MMNRRWRLLMGASLVALSLMACAPAAPVATTAPPKSTEATKPAATAVPAKPTDAPPAKPAEAKPAASPTAAAKPAEGKPAASPAAKVEAKPADKPVAAASPKPAAKAADISVPKPSGNLSFKWSIGSDLGFAELPIWMTAQRLARDGWKMDIVEFAQSELATEALVKGDVQVSSGTTSNALVATERGARLALIGERNLNEWVLVSTPELRQCSDLQGKRLAIHSEGAVSAAMARNWVASVCRGTTPNYLIIAGSANRAQALINGQIDATPLELADWVRVETQAPGKFRILENFSRGLPNLSSSAIYTSSDWLSANRPVMTAFMAELLKTFRMVAEQPALLESAAKERLPEIDAQLLPKIIQAYFSIDAFPPNGGLTAQKVEGTIAFFTEGGQIKPGMTVAQAANLGVLEDALNIVGRVPGKP
jgi:NitT/TauT family transport system substrate-binding protein